MNHHPPLEHYGRFKRLTPRFAADNKYSWNAVALFVQGTAARRKATLPPPNLADLVNLDTCLTEFFKIRFCSLASVTAWRHSKCNYYGQTTEMPSSSVKENEKGKILWLPFSFTLHPGLQEGFWDAGRHALLWAYPSPQGALDAKPEKVELTPVMQTPC